MTILAATHSGKFHADDVLAWALLLSFYDPEAQLLRSRKKEEIEKADIVFAIDVSGSMDERIEALITGISNLATSLVGEHKFSIVTFGQAEEEGEPFLYLSLLQNSI